MQDRFLVESVLAGKIDEYTKIVEKYSNAVYAVALSIVKDVHAAEDIAQEVFVKAWLNLSKLTERDKLSNWLFIIASRQSVDWIRKHSKEITREDNPDLWGHTPTLESVVERRTNNMIIGDTIHSLKKPHKEVILLYYMSDMKVKEISEFLGLSISAVESRLRRAKQQLKRELSELEQKTLSKHRLGKSFEQKVMNRITGLAAINLPVKDVEVSFDWYVSYLGCTLIREPQQFENEKNAMIKMGNGPTVLLHEENDTINVHFMRAGKPAPIFELQTDDIEGLYKQLKKAGISVTKRYDNLPCGKYFQVEDPDGNWISIVQF